MAVWVNIHDERVPRLPPSKPRARRARAVFHARRRAILRASRVRAARASRATRMSFVEICVYVGYSLLAHFAALPERRLRFAHSSTLFPR